MKSMTIKYEFLRETIRRKAITFLTIAALATMLAMVSSCDEDTIVDSTDLMWCLSNPDSPGCPQE